MTVSSRSVATLDLGFVSRATWYGIVGVGILSMALLTPWGHPLSGTDFYRYLAGGLALLETGDPYTGTHYLYSPAFALLIAPLNALPPVIALNLWRIATLVVLAWSIRGAGTGALLVLAMPFLWMGDLMWGNVMGIATAGMIAVIVRPSVATVIVYAVFVALVPKPAFLPVLLYGFLVVPEARRWVLLIGAFGAAMLLWPGYVDAIRAGPDGVGQLFWPQPWALLLAGVLTLVGLRQPRLLGVAAVFASPYVWFYHFTTLGTLFVKPLHHDRQVELHEVRSRDRAPVGDVAVQP